MSTEPSSSISCIKSLWIEKALVAVRISGNCGTRSSGGGGRLALYWSYIWLRNVDSDLSRMTAMWVGPSALLSPSASFHSMVV
jgi:hypothetical protein